MKIKVPNVFDVLGISYKVFLMEFLKADTGTEGEANLRLEEIWVDPEFKNSYRTYILIHEFLEPHVDYLRMPIIHDDICRVAMLFTNFLSQLEIELDWDKIQQKSLHGSQ